uniref:Uncharacterized protein n=1 Tax=Peronospora matthiolae TaxID=2874970 RepID=A0AAV1UQN0_9STRA
MALSPCTRGNLDSGHSYILTSLLDELMSSFLVLNVTPVCLMVFSRAVTTDCCIDSHDLPRKQRVSSCYSNSGPSELVADARHANGFTCRMLQVLARSLRPLTGWAASITTSRTSGLLSKHLS